MMKFIVERARREEVVLAGTSAGAMIMCSPIFGEGFTYGHLYFSTSIGLAVKKITDGEVNGTELYDDRKGLNSLQYRDNGGIMPGFNLIPFLIDSHVNTRGRLGRMVPAMIQTKNELGIGLSESTCLYFHNDVGTIYGKSGVYIVDLSKAIKTSKEYFSARNVLVTYLTSGDSFDFKTKKVTPHSSKSKIVVPAYSGHFDSEDIFGEY
jgi:cyanophycinase-like exopeptidase